MKYSALYFTTQISYLHKYMHKYKYDINIRFNNFIEFNNLNNPFFISLLRYYKKVSVLYYIQNKTPTIYLKAKTINF